MTAQNAPHADVDMTRDARLDFFRGLCLVMIYVNHIPGTIFENFTSRNFGLSDAAEGFIFMSGCAIALAYGKRMTVGVNLPIVWRAWQRSWKLYLVHLMTSVWAIAIAATAIVFMGADEAFRHNSFNMLFDQPFEVIVGVAAMTHQFGYVNILPMYVVLMLAAPFLVRLGQRAPLLLLIASITFWALVAHFRLNLPNYPQPGGWFFNPLAWQLLFCLGILTGLAIRQNKRLVPIQSWLVILCAVWLVFCLFWAQNKVLAHSMNTALGSLYSMGVPYFIAGFDKTFLSIPRLLHFLALAYILSLPVLIPQIAASRAMSPFRRIGKHGLATFALGTILAMIAQAIKDIYPTDFVEDAILVIGGVLLLWGFATLLERIKPAQKLSVA